MQRLKVIEDEYNAQRTILTDIKKEHKQLQDQLKRTQLMAETLATEN